MTSSELFLRGLLDRDGRGKKKWRAIKDKFGHWQFSLPIAHIFTKNRPSKKKVN